MARRRRRKRPAAASSPARWYWLVPARKPVSSAVLFAKSTCTSSNRNGTACIVRSAADCLAVKRLPAERQLEARSIAICGAAERWWHWRRDGSGTGARDGGFPKWTKRTMLVLHRNGAAGHNPVEQPDSRFAGRRLPRTASGIGGAVEAHRRPEKSGYLWYLRSRPSERGDGALQK